MASEADSPVSLESLHRDLLAQFKELRWRREGPVYLVEHGMPKERLAEICGAVRQAIAGRGFPNWYFEAHSLPLLIVATEVGYEFGGNAREYWPVLEQRVGGGFDTHLDRRYDLRDLFRQQTNLLDVTPPETYWALQFSLIAWPITHAVLPMWLHERLLRCILRCRSPIRPKSPYLQEMREEAAGDAPLSNFLAQGDLAQRVLEGLMRTGGDDALSDPLLERLRRDVVESPRTRALARQVRQRQIAIRPARARAPAASATPAQPDVVNLVRMTLLIEDEELGGRVSARIPPASLPPLPAGAGRLRVRLLGAGRYQTLDGLTQDGAALPDAPIADPAVCLISEADLPTASAQLVAHLRSLQLDMKRPLVFKESADGVSARQRTERSFTRFGRFWVVPGADHASPPAGVERRGSLFGSPCFRCDASDRSAQGWLKSVGVDLVNRPSVTVLGSPSLDQPLSAYGAHNPGDTVALYVEQGPVEAEGVLMTDGIHLLALPSKAVGLAIKLRADGARDNDLDIDVEDGSRDRGPLARLQLEGPGTVAALVSQRLSVRASGRVRAAGLRLCVSASEGGGDWVTAYSSPLHALPTVVSREDPIWDVLAAKLSGTKPVELRAELGGICSERWFLDVEEVASSEAGEEAGSEEAHWLNGSAPWEAAARDADSAVCLAQPFRVRDGESTPILGAGTALRGSRTVLGAHPVEREPPRVLRRMESDGGIGARELATAWLCWSTAGAEDLVAGGLRGLVAERLDAWLTAALCGATWVEAEGAAARALVRTFGDAVAQSLWGAGVVRDPLIDAQLGAVAHDVPRELARRLNAVEGWLRSASSGADHEEELCERLAQMSNGAYRRVQAARVDDEADAPCPQTETAEAVRAAIDEVDRGRTAQPLLSLILPWTLRDVLAALDYAGATDAELLGELQGALKRAALGWTDDAGALWAMWTRPHQTSVGSLRSALEKGLEDRVAARIIRYAAVRRRAARGMSL